VNADLSVAPEIAQLAVSVPPARPDGARQDGARPDSARPRTIGRLAGDLADLAAAPERWWDRVRFDPAGPVRIPVPDGGGSWLLVLPPGATADCDCRLATALAGEAGEIAAGEIAAGESQPPPLRPGRVRVHGAGAPHRLRAAGPGYSVTLHAR
jgi:hypothetical protein